jgi:thiol-disulfide isomerase/thioredoxin
MSVVQFTLPAGEREAVEVDDPEAYLNIVSQSTRPFVVMYAAKWCGHCQRMKPLFKDMAKKYSVRAYIVDADKVVTKEMQAEHPELFTGLSGWPTFGIVANGSFTLREEGEMPENKLEDIFKVAESS